MANRYWVGGTGTWNTSSTTNWSASSGGASGASVPTAADSVFFDQAGTYTVTRTGALTCLDFTVSAGTVTFSSTGTLAISGSLTLLAGTVWSATGANTFNSTSSGRTITTNGVTITGAITFNGVGGGWTLGSALTTTSAANFTAGTFSTSTNNYSLTVGGTTDVVGATLILNGSTITLNNNYLLTSGIITAGTSQINTSSGGFRDTASNAYYNITVSSPGGMIFTASNCTFNNLTITGRTTPGVSFFQFNGTPGTIGTFAVTAGTDATCRIQVQPNSGTRTITANSVSLTDVDFEGIIGGGLAAPFTGTRLGNRKNNSNITFPAAKNVYWNLAAGGNWGGAIAWATTSGGTPAINNFPLAQDTAIFESTGLNSGATVTFNASYNVGTIDMSARTSNTMTLAMTAGQSMYGNWTNGTGTTISGTGGLSFVGSNTQTITSSGVTFTCGIGINSPSGTVTLQDNLTINRAAVGALTLTNGTLNLNGQTLTLSATATATFLTATGTKNLTFNGGSLVIAASGATAFNNAVPTGFTTTAGTGTGVISLTSASAKTFVGGGSTYNCAINQGGAGALTITGSNTFSNITNTYNATGATSILFTAGTTSTFTNWNANGAAGRLLTIGSVTAASHTLSKASGTVNADFLSISRSTATGGATWNAANSTDGGNNTGWIFASAPSSTGNFFAFF